MNLVAIASSWYEFAKGDPETKNRMSRRLEICDSCPNKVQMDSFGKKIMSNINHPDAIYKCGKCSCPLVALASGKNNSCEFWNKEESFY